MKVSDQFFDILTKFEGFVKCPYRDQVGIPTIGIGTTIYPSGKKVTMADPCISLNIAQQYVADHISATEDELSHKLPGLNQNQFDALVSFIYNVGDAAFEDSTLLKVATENINDPEIRNQFMRWNRAGGKVLNALTLRRKQEADLYFKPV